MCLRRHHAAEPIDDQTRRLVQAHRTRVVSQTLPLAQNVAHARPRKRGDVHKARDERLELGNDTFDLRLLEHKLANQCVIGVAHDAPG